MNEVVVLSAWLHVDDRSMTDVVVRVGVNGTLRRATVTENGRITDPLPPDAEAVLRFAKPGHVFNEVTVDTSHVQSGVRGQKCRIRFAVILELECRMCCLTCARPLGNIGFELERGRMAVAHERKLVPKRRHAPIVL